MYMFRSLYEKVVAPTPAKAELAAIDGCFYLVRPTVTVKGAKECLFQTAVASIRRTSQPFQYELVVSRGVTDEEAQLLADEGQEDLDEYVSLIDERMHFTAYPASEAESDKPGAVSLSWLDLAGEEEDSFLIVIEGAPKEDIAAFEMIMYRCMWERKHNRDAKDVKNEELLGYRISKQEPAQAHSKPSPAKSSTSATTSISATKTTPNKKQPLFRAPSPSSSDDEIADELTSRVAKMNVSSGSAGTAATSVSPPKAPASRGHSVATASSSSSAPSPSPVKDKGKAREASTAPAMYPVMPKVEDEEDELEQSQQSQAPAPAVDVKEEEQTVDSQSTQGDALPTQQEITDATYDPPDNRTLMISEECDLNLFDKATGMFMQQEAGTLGTLWSVRGQSYSCWLTIAGKDGFIWVSTPVDGTLPLHFLEEHLSVVISFDNPKVAQQFTWLMKFEDPSLYRRMNFAFTQGVFEANNGAGSWSKLKPDEQRYTQATYTDDVEMEGAEPWNPEEDEDYIEEEKQRRAAEEVRDRFGQEELYSDEEEETASSEDETDEEVAPGRKKAKNTLLAVGYKGMSFVVRGDMIGVFENEKGKGKKLKFMTNISGIKRPNSQSTFTPGKVMLHNQDTTMVLSDPHQPNSLYQLDLTTGKVVDEWRVSDRVNVNNFIPDSKRAQETAQQTFVGTSSNALFRIDPRLRGNKLVDSQYKDYKTKVDFSAAVTTTDGKIALASNKGEIKLFDKLGLIAKTSLPNMGQAITGIDVTGDGRYIVATTKEKLLFLDTKIHEGKNSGLSAFDKPFPADAKPQPHPLRLKPEHKAYIEGGVNFTPAKFNIGEGLEKTIVTSTGPYIVTWNFRAVKSGRFYEYKIKRYGETIVADQFAWGNDREIVVTTANDMRLEAKSSLQAPSRASLAPVSAASPRRSGIRRSGVVQQWDD